MFRGFIGFRGENLKHEEPVPFLVTLAKSQIGELSKEELANKMAELDKPIATAKKED